jgi:hypothetical protein
MMFLTAIALSQNLLFGSSSRFANVPASIQVKTSPSRFAEVRQKTDFQLAPVFCVCCRISVPIGLGPIKVSRAVTAYSVRLPVLSPLK